MGSSGSIEREKKEVEFGEKIYEIVCEYYPETSENITGMLLDVEYDELKQLLSTTRREELLERIHLAAGSLVASSISDGENCKQEEIKDCMNESCDDACNKKMALGETLFSLVESKHPTDAERLTGILLEMDAQSVKHLIEDPELLENKIEEILKCLQGINNITEANDNKERESDLKSHCDKTIIGEELHNLVCGFNTEYTDKITGMLLEMDLQDLEVIVKDHVALKEKVTLALETLNKEEKEAKITTSFADEEQDKTLLGEKLYYIISEWYPDNVDKITGMLLELDVSALVMLLEDSEGLKSRALLAANVLSETN